jgi:hypothetical protein
MDTDHHGNVISRKDGRNGGVGDYVRFTPKSVVHLSTWREELYRKGVLDRDAKSPREEFKRIRMQLQARGLIGVNGELVWKA